jgi:hypothetical protein
MRIIPPHRLLLCQMSRAEEKILCCGTELCGLVQETRVEGRRRRSLPQGAQRYTGETAPRFPLWILPCVPLCSLW